MRGIKTRFIERGVYEILSWDTRIDISPADAIRALEKLKLGENEKEALAFFFGLSVKYGKWVGVSWRRLKEEAHVHCFKVDEQGQYEGCYGYILLRTTLDALVRPGFLENPFEAKEDWWRHWLNLYCFREIYPTPELLVELWHIMNQHQTEVGG